MIKAYLVGVPYELETHLHKNICLHTSLDERQYSQNCEFQRKYYIQYVKLF